MAYTLLWMEGFEHYSLDQSGSTFGDVSKMLDGLWIQATGSGSKIVSTEKRTGTYSLELGALSQFRRSFGGSYKRIGMQFGFFMNDLPVLNNKGFVLGQIRDGANAGLLGLQITTTGRIQIMKGGLDANFGAGNAVLLAESTLELAAGTWNHFEIKFFLDAAGYVKVRINGRDFISYTGNTAGGHSGTAGDAAQMAFGSFDGVVGYEWPGGAAQYIDDIAIGTWIAADDSTFLGQYGVYYLKPNADTAVASWSLTSGTQGFALINEVAPDDDVNFIFTPTVTAKSAFAVEPLPADIVSVAAVMPIMRSRKTDTGNCAAKMGVISNGTEDLAASDHPLTTSYDYFFDIWMLDPHTADVWNPLFMPEIEIERTE